MTRAIFILSAIVLFMASCGNKDAYTITGTFVEGNHNGKTVYLQKLDPLWKDRITIDSVKIIDNKYEFSGIVEKGAYVGFIKIEGEYEVIVPIVIEPGKIELGYGGEKEWLKGTPKNDEIYELFSTMSQSGAPDSHTVYEFAKEDLNDILRAYFFVWISDGLSGDQMKKDIETMNPEMRSLKAIQHLEKIAQKRIETEVGKDYVDVKGVTPEGKEIALSEYVGKDNCVLLSFWKSGDPGFSIGEMPHITKLHDMYKDKGLQILGVYLSSNSAVWKKDIAELELTWPQISNMKGWNSDLAETYGVFSSPYFILIDKDGKILERGLFSDVVAKQKFDIWTDKE